MKYFYFLLIIILATACSDTSSSTNKCENDPICNSTEGLQCSNNVLYSCDYDNKGCKRQQTHILL